MKQTLHPGDLDGDLLAAGSRAALELLHRNATTRGILAASPGARARQRHYATIFARDAAICALGMAASGDPGLAECARAGLRTLGQAQADNGQLPNYVDPTSGEVDFWYTGCIDASLWWLIAVHLCDQLEPGAGLAAELAPQVAAARRWLACQEHPQWGLLQQNEASDWADIMPRSGFVLYTNALWLWVRRLYGDPQAERTREAARGLFQPFDGPEPQERRLRLLTERIRAEMAESPFLLSFVNFFSWGAEADLFANLLAVLSGLVDADQGRRLVDAMLDLEAHRPYPLRVVGTPIAPGDPLWRPYMLRHGQNLPWQYHNGGIWPFVGGFWVLVLQVLGRDQLAWQELEGLARVNALGGWQFNEWFQGRSGVAMGMPGQSWNAAMYLLAHRALEHGLPWRW